MALGSFLVVDSQREAREAVAQTCRELRRTVAVAGYKEARSVLARDVHLTGLITEADLADGCGLELLAELRHERPMLPALVLTGRTEPEVVNRAHALRAELRAKPTRRRSLRGFLRRAVAFERVPDERVSWLVEHVIRRYELSPRESDVLAAAVQGAPRKQLADELGTSENTIKTCVRNLLRKCGASSLDELGRELLAQALEGSHVTGFEGGWRETGRYEAPFTIPPPPERSEGDPGR